MNRFAIAVAATLAFCAPAHAQDDRLPPPAFLIEGLVQERDVGLVFDYLRGALDAAVEGRESPPPAELERRAQEIGGEMKRRGAVAARIFIDLIEKNVREGLRDRAPSPQLPPASPSAQRI